jgi:hypothetical protein
MLILKTDHVKAYHNVVAVYFINTMHSYIPFINIGNYDMKKKIIYILSAMILLNSAYTYAGSKHGYNAKANHVNKLPEVAALVLISGISYWVADNVFYKKQHGRYVVTPSPIKKHSIRNVPTRSVVVYQSKKKYSKHKKNHHRNNTSNKQYIIINR